MKYHVLVLDDPAYQWIANPILNKWGKHPAVSIESDDMMMPDLVSLFTKVAEAVGCKIAPPPPEFSDDDPGEAFCGVYLPDNTGVSISISYTE